MIFNALFLLLNLHFAAEDTDFEVSCSYNFADDTVRVECALKIINKSTTDTLFYPVKEGQIIKDHTIDYKTYGTLGILGDNNEIEIYRVFDGAVDTIYAILPMSNVVVKYKNLFVKSVGVKDPSFYLTDYFYLNETDIPDDFQQNDIVKIKPAVKINIYFQIKAAVISNLSIQPDFVY